MEIADLKCRGYYYLASPYSSPSIGERHIRAIEAREYQAALVKSGLFIYSPIAAMHELAILHELPKSYEFWEDQNKIFILSSAGMIIAKMEGWEESEGIYQEIKLCRQLKIKMFTFDRRRMKIASYGGSSFG